MYSWLKAPVILISMFFLSTAVLVIFTSLPDEDFSVNSTTRFVHSVSKEVLRGHLNGHFHGQRKFLNVSDLEPGDIILCHNHGGGYGYWTHSVLYVGNGYAVDSNNFSEGTKLLPIGRYSHYDQLEVERAKISWQTKERIVSEALKQIGTPYNPISALSDTRSEYCSKLIWQVYNSQHLRLCSPKTWVLPDDVAKSPILKKVPL